jgi:twitching motility protein PilT
MAKIDAFSQLMNEQGASDLHLVTGQQPAIRLRGEIERIKYDLLENDSLKAMLYEIAPEYKIKQFEETGDVYFAYEIPGLARYRANFLCRNGAAPPSSEKFPARFSRPNSSGCPP